MRTKTVALACVVLISSGVAFGKYSGGTGEPNDPYRIATANDLNDIGNHPNDWGSLFVMVNDINLAAYTGTQFNMIGYYFDRFNLRAFTGVFDGNDHTIWSFTYHTTDRDHLGMFGHVDGNARIENLSLKNVDIDIGGDSDCAGSLVGFMQSATVVGCHVEQGSVLGKEGLGGLVGLSRGVIENCYALVTVSGTSRVGGLVGKSSGAFWGIGRVSNCYTRGSVSGSSHVGGLIGECDWGAVTNDCCSTCDVTGGDYSGGLVGNTEDDCGPIEGCYATGTVSGGRDVGGLAGRIFGTIVNKCFATGDVSASSYSAGGLVGQNSGTIRYSYATGNVLGTICVGGLAGRNGEMSPPSSVSGTAQDCYATGSVSGSEETGGLVGQHFRSSITRCYSVGPVSGNTLVGGLVGRNIDSSIFASFWDVDTSGCGSMCGSQEDGGSGCNDGYGKSTIAMESTGTFTDAAWDFLEVWDIGENQSYPFLRQYSPGDLNHDGVVNWADIGILASGWLQEKQ